MSDRITLFNGSYNELISQVKATGTLCVVDFFATWCGPCQRLGQLLPGIAQAYQDVSFFKVDVEQNRDLASAFEVRSLPSVFFMIGEKILDSVLGGDPQAIKSKIERYREEAKNLSKKTDKPVKLTEKSQDGIIRFTGNYKEILKEIAQRNVLCVVYFNSSSFDSCAALAEGIKGLVGEFQDVVFYEIDVEKNKYVRVGFNVLALPAVYFVKGDKIISDISGNKIDEIKAEITKHK
jgi:thioredoxin 1